MSLKIRIGRTIPYLTVCKWIVCAFYLYLNWFKEIRGDVPILLYGLVILLTAMVILRCVLERRIELTRIPLILWVFFAYAVYSLVTGPFVAVNRSVLLSSVVTFAAFAIVCFDCWYICDSSEDTDWLLNILAFCAIVCAVQTAFFGVPYKNGVFVTTMSPTNNPNSLAFVLFLGIFAILAKSDSSRGRILVSAGLIGFLFYAIILTGSRKVFLVSAELIVLWLLYYFVSRTRRTMSVWELFRILFLLALSIAAMEFLRRNFSSASIYSRLTQMIHDKTDNVRFRLYEEAFSFWKRSPIFGIGLGQYALRSQYGFYSHSSYAEIFACGGTVGVLIFFTPFLTVIRRAIHWLVSGAREQFIYVVMLLAELELGLGMIFVYNFSHMLVLTLLFYVLNERLSHVEDP